MKPYSLIIAVIVGVVAQRLSFTNAAESPQTVSRTSRVSASGAGNSFLPAFSADGTRVAFASTAQFFPTSLTNSAGEIFVRDFASGALIWASTNVADYFVALTNYHRCFNPLISADGRFVAYKATNPEATNLVLLLPPIS